MTAFPTPPLDERTFQDLVDEMRRLIPAFCPEWTALDLTDPGVVLVELFAWVGEMVLYRLNQIPDEFYTRMLNLLGAEPFPASAATTDITFWLTDVPDQPVLIPANTEVATSGDDPVVFATTTDLELSGVSLTHVLTSESDRFFDRTDSNDGDVLFNCLEGNEVGDSLYLGFEQPLSNHAVRIELAVETWDLGEGVPSGLPAVRWEYWRADDAWAAATVDDDTMMLLNRDGAQTVHVGDEHRPLTLGGMGAHWLRLRLLPDGVPFSSLRVSSITARTVGGTVSATHSMAMLAASLGVSDGRSGQRFSISRSPILSRVPDETVRTFRHGEEGEVWTEVSSFADSGPGDRHFTWSSTTGEIRFGPSIRQPAGYVSQHGAVPPLGSEIAVTAYRVGGGVAGNVGPGTLRVLRSALPYVDRVENLQGALGGVDAETIENAKVRLPQEIGRSSRVVTATDYERACLEADYSVARVRCLAPSSKGGPVRVLVVPRVDDHVHGRSLDQFALPDAMVARLADYLDERRTLGTSVEIGTPYYQGVTVAALLTARPGRPPVVVRERALAALYRFLDPVVGGWAGTGWPYGAPLSLSTLFPLLEAVDGVERVDEILLFDYDVRNHERLGIGRASIGLTDNSLFLSANHKVVVR